MARRGIEIPMHELLTFSMLMALGGCEPQVKGHVMANLHVGNDRVQLIDILTQRLPFIGYPAQIRGRLVPSNDYCGAGWVSRGKHDHARRACLIDSRAGSN